LSVGRIRQCVTSFGSHRSNTDWSLKVSISSYRTAVTLSGAETVQERPKAELKHKAVPSTVHKQ